MKRFHVHLHVDDLAQSIGFYSKLFAANPARQESDYAKWMLQDPPVNFAISTRGSKAGIDHLGIQTDDEAELNELKARAASADLDMVDEGATTCCYARSEKHWVTDPQGIAWEHFQTLDNIPVFNEKEVLTSHEESAATAAASCAPAPISTAASAMAGEPAAACCPPARGKAIAIPVKPSSSCC